MYMQEMGVSMTTHTVNKRNGGVSLTAHYANTRNWGWIS